MAVKRKITQFLIELEAQHALTKNQEKNLNHILNLNMLMILLKKIMLGQCL